MRNNERKRGPGVCRGLAVESRNWNVFGESSYVENRKEEATDEMSKMWRGNGIRQFHLRSLCSGNR